MSTVDDVLAEIRKKKEARKTFGAQFLEGAERSATLGYSGKDSPADLPLTGKIGRIAGEFSGAMPAILAGAAGLGAVGITGLAAELAAGTLYGLAMKPEEHESRLNNAMQMGAMGGVGYGVVKGLGAAGKAIFGRGAKEIAEQGAESTANLAMREGAESGSDEFSGTPLHFPGAKMQPEEVAEGTPFGLFKSPEDLEAYMQKQKDTEFLRDRALRAQDDFVPYEPGPEQAIRGMGEDFLSPFNYDSPEAFEKAQKAVQYDGMVNSWARDFLKHQTPEDTMLSSASKIASDDIEAAATKLSRESGLHNIAETPIPEPLPVAINEIEEQIALQQSIDEIVAKNALPIETVQAASQVDEPINFIMSKGVNFEDAADLVEKVSERARKSYDPRPVQTVKFEGKNAPQAVPPWEQVSKRRYNADEVFDLFHNFSGKSSGAARHGLVERKDDAFKVTEKGYSFLKQYNPEGLIGQYPDWIDKRVLGAVRMQGYSEETFTPAQLKDMGIRMNIKTAQEKDFVRPAVVKGKVVPGEYQLTSKGAGMLAGGKGANANVNLKAYDMAAGRRFVPGETEKIALAAAERKRNQILFKDIWEQTKNLAKGCPE